MMMTLMFFCIWLAGWLDIKTYALQFRTDNILTSYNFRLIAGQPTGKSVHCTADPGSALWGTNRNSGFHKLSRPSKCVNFTLDIFSLN